MNQFSFLRHMTAYQNGTSVSQVHQQYAQVLNDIRTYTHPPRTLPSSICTNAFRERYCILTFRRLFFVLSGRAMITDVYMR